MVLASFDVRPEEWRRTLWAFIYLYCAISAFIVSRIARAVLFLEIPNYREQLPLTYIGTAVAVSSVMFVYARLERRWRRDHINAVTLALLVGINVVFWVLLKGGAQAVYWAFYVWVEMFGTLLVVQYWSFINEIFNQREAKRLFALIAGGGVLANIVTGFGINRWVGAIGTENLLMVICGFLAVCWFCVRALGFAAVCELTAAWERPSARTAATQTIALPATHVFAMRHVQLIAVVVVLTYIASTIVDYQFQIIVGDYVPVKNDRSAYYGVFYGVTGLIAGVMQFGFTSRILERFGVLIALLLLPVSMLLGVAGMASAWAMSALSAVSLTKGAENVFRYTINDSTLQLLYLPVPSQVRGRAKALIDGMLKPLAVGVGGVVLVLGHLDHLALLTLVGAVLVIWCFVLIALKREYVRSLVQTLQRRRTIFAESKSANVDEQTLQVLDTALDSKDVGHVLHALEMFGVMGVHVLHTRRSKIEQCLRHASEEVRLAALQLVRKNCVQCACNLTPLLQDGSVAVRAQAVLTICAMQRERALPSIQPMLSDPHSDVRAAAIAGLIRYGSLDGMLACADKLKAMLESAEAHDCEQAAWILGEIGVQSFYQPLLPLFSHADARVQNAAVAAAGRLQNKEFVRYLIDALARPNVRHTAIAALVQYGSEVIDPLATALASTALSSETKMALCRVLARLADARSVAALLPHLTTPNTQLRMAVLQSLDSLIEQVPAARPSALLLSEVLLKEARSAIGWMRLRQELQLESSTETSPAKQLMDDALEYRFEGCRERTLLLLGIKYAAKTVALVAQNLKSSTPRTRANALEVLENLLDKNERLWVMPVFEDGTVAKRLSTLPSEEQEQSVSAERRLSELMSGQDPWLQTCAVYMAGKHFAQELREPLATMRQADVALVRETACSV